MITVQYEAKRNGEHRFWVGRVGASYSVTSCDLRILMDQPTESISAHDPPSLHGDS
jgi:hypothetical protein